LTDKLIIIKTHFKFFADYLAALIVQGNIGHIYNNERRSWLAKGITLPALFTKT